MLFKNRKIYLILYVTLFYIQAKAQKIEKFYDYKWKECKVNEAEYYSITQKTDSGYLLNSYLIRGKKILY